MNGDTIDYHLAQIHTKMKRIYLLLSLLTGCLYMQAAIYNVRDFGAKADGKAIDSPAINRAIEAAAQEGGGTVYLPAGEYACYSIRLKSNITSIWNKAHASSQPFRKRTKDTTWQNPMSIINTRTSVTATGRTP